MSVVARTGGQVLTVSAIVLPRLTVYVGVTRSATKEWKHLQDLELADPGFAAAGGIDLLFGAEVYAAILGPGVRKGGTGEPIAQQTSLGWIVSESMSTAASHGVASLHQCSVDEPLSALVRRFWEQEEVQQPAPSLTPEERECEELFARTHTRTGEGRYVVRLPVASPLPDLSATRAAAAGMLNRMECRFAQDTCLEELYKEFMKEYERLGHMTLVERAVKGEERVVYLPHHGVLKESSATTKLRVVFNGSQLVNGGECLNSQVLTGPNLLPPLADILLKWRRHRYAFIADIEKMYRQILVHEEDRDLQRILWRSGTGGDIQEFRLNTVTYGLAYAPFLAMRSLHQLANEYHQYPEGASVLRQDTYMDDILFGADILEAALNKRDELIKLCRAGGFPLKKWTANSPLLLADLPPEDRLPLDLRSVTRLDEIHAGIAMEPEDRQLFLRCPKPRADSNNEKDSPITNRSTFRSTRLVGTYDRPCKDRHPIRVAAGARLGHSVAGERC